MTIHVHRCSLPFAGSLLHALLHALLHFRAYRAAVAQFRRSLKPSNGQEKSR